MWLITSVYSRLQKPTVEEEAIRETGNEATEVQKLLLVYLKLGAFWGSVSHFFQVNNILRETEQCFAGALCTCKKKCTPFFVNDSFEVNFRGVQERWKNFTNASNQSTKT